MNQKEIKFPRMTIAIENKDGNVMIPQNYEN